MNCQRCGSTNYDKNLKGTVTDADGTVIQCSICSQPPQQIVEYAHSHVKSVNFQLQQMTLPSACLTRHRTGEILESLKIAQDWVRILESTLTD